MSILGGGAPCHWCRRRMTSRDTWLYPTKDHIITREAGGTDDDDNLVWSCRCCNELRGNLPVERWIEVIVTLGPNYWRVFHRQNLRGGKFYARYFSVGGTPSG